MMPSLYVTPKIIFGPLEMMRHDTLIKNFQGQLCMVGRTKIPANLINFFLIWISNVLLTCFWSNDYFMLTQVAAMVKTQPVQFKSSEFGLSDCDLIASCFDFDVKAITSCPFLSAEGHRKVETGQKC